MIEYNLIKPELSIEPIAFQAAAIIDCGTWLRRQREEQGVRAIYLFGDEKYPSARLTLKLSSRFFMIKKIMTEFGEEIETISAIVRGSPDSIIGSPLAWFALIPWEVSVFKNRSGTQFLNLTSPALVVSEFKSSRFNLQLPFNPFIEPRLMKASQFGAFCGEDAVLGWPVDWVSRS